MINKLFVAITAVQVILNEIDESFLQMNQNVTTDCN